ncbi:hypothetical protein REPUB_Repub03eG0131900 [Reevesia pubescens]
MDAISLVSFLLETITPLATKEAMLIFGASGKVSSLHAELQFIDERLKQYDDRFMEGVMDLAHEAKDVIETFVTKNDIQKQRNPAAKLIYGVGHAAMLRKVATKVEKIKKNIEEIDGYEKKYCVGEAKCNLDKAHWLEKQRREVEEENVVGFGEAAKQVSQMLLNKRLRRDVISIVGMAGSGKTTLAKMIYGNSGKHFEYRAWVFVPSKYRIRDMLMSILESMMSIGEETSKLDDSKLAEKLKKFLQGKRYLVVMDGVETTQLWEALEKARVFPDEKHGSRILLTTRSKGLASQASSTDHIHSLKPLGEEARWELLEKVVFKDETCPQELVKLGKQIAAKCAGLPLAIVSLASLLARNRTYRQWLDILSNVSWYLNQEDGSPCFGILALTYDSIPEHLKLCFLYLGVFPSGFEISGRQVISLWIAEELIKELAGAKVEEIAERYLEELIDLSLIEVARKRSDGGVKTFRIHEFWWNFCVIESERTRFLDVQMKLGSLPRSNRPRRLSIHYELRYILSNPLHLSHLHSLLCFYSKGSLDSDGFTLHCHHFRSLRVLDLGSTCVSRIHESIKSLSLLKYLKINHPSLNRLPPSLCSLPNLQTLDIKNTCVPCLPSGIWGMQNLRHLLLPRLTTLLEYRDEPEKRLWHLQTLSAITPDRTTADLIIGSKFPSLIKLTLYSEDRLKTKRCLECLYKLDCLQNLKIINPTGFPNSGTFPTSLIKVTLMKTDLIADKVLGMLDNLPRLQVLKLLTRSISGPKLEMRPNSFPQLRFLFMEEIVIRTWMMGDGAMDSLEELSIIRCNELETLPQQLWHLNNLRQVEMSSPSQCLRRELEQVRVEPIVIQMHF